MHMHAQYGHMLCIDMFRATIHAHVPYNALFKTLLKKSYSLYMRALITLNCTPS